MKTIVTTGRYLMFLPCLFLTWITCAQPSVTKTGYARVEYIIGQLPETKQIESALNSLQKQLENQIQAKSDELKKKYADFLQLGPTAPEAVRNNAQREIQLLQENLDLLQQEAQSTMEKKQAQLIEPVYQKIAKAIEDVAKEHGYQLIHNAQSNGGRTLLYADPALDVSDLVLKKMGVSRPSGAAN